MIENLQIQTIESAHVIHELIFKPIGTYIIRYSTKNDDILTKIKDNLENNSRPFVVLSVRVDEIEHQFPIINYRLPIDQSNNKQTLISSVEHFINDQINNNELPQLKKQHIIDIENINWRIDYDRFPKQYRSVFLSENSGELSGNMTCFSQAENCTVNVYNKSFVNDEKGFQHEFSILKNLSYFHIASFYGICTDHSHVNYLIFANNGQPLKAKCPLQDTGDLLIKESGRIAYQIACGMIYLENKNIIHGDLHAGNILIDEYNYVRIADFGHAFIKDDNETLKDLIQCSQLKFQPRRLAPECLPSPPEDEQISGSIKDLLDQFSSKTDVWAYGLLLIELFIESHLDVYPYIPMKSNDDDDEIIQFVHFIKLECHVHEQPIDCPVDIYDILKKCWFYEPEQRISFTDLQNAMKQLLDSKK